MPDRLTSLLLKLYPEECRQSSAPQIEADLYHPGANRFLAIVVIVRTALFHRATYPGPYIWIAATMLAAIVVAASGTVTLQSAYRLLQPKFNTAAELYALLFFAVFIVILSVLLLAIHWLQKCSKSKA